MPIDIHPPFENQSIPVRELLDDLRAPIGWNRAELDVMPISGGLSGAAVALVFISGSNRTPTLVKFGKSDILREEIERFHNHIEPSIKTPQMRNRFVPLIFPPKDSAFLQKEGLDGLHYTVLAYEYAKSGSRNRVHSLDTFIRMHNKEEVRSLILRLLSLLEDTLHADRNKNERQNLRLFYLPRVPWSTFMPVACTSVGNTDWRNFVTELPKLWKEAAGKSRWTIPANPTVIHGDLRCANILVSDESETLSLIDYGQSGYGNPMMDLARLEADILLRAAQDQKEARELLGEMIFTEEFCRPKWENSHRVLRIIFALRQYALSLASSIFQEPCGEEKVFMIYRMYLIGHATRFCRLDDPLLRGIDHRMDYLWYTLSLMRQALGNKALSRPITSSTLHFLNDMEKCGVVDFYWGRERRNTEKIAALNEDGTIRLLAHTGHSYLNDEANLFFNSIKNRLGSGHKVKIILLNPYSVEGAKLGLAEGRGNLRGPELYIHYYEENTELFKRFFKCLEIYKTLENSGIELMITNYSPDATILITDRFAFFEPYVIGRLSWRYYPKEIKMNIPEEIKMNAPEMKIIRRADVKAEEDTPLYQVAESQFDFFWNRALSVEEFEKNINHFRNEFVRFLGLRQDMMALHESWFALDPIVGCSKKCSYCFLSPLKINGMKNGPYLAKEIEDSYEYVNKNKMFKSQQDMPDDYRDIRLPVPLAIGNSTELFDDHQYHRKEALGVRPLNNLEEAIKILKTHATFTFRETPILCLMTQERISPRFFKALKEVLAYPRLRVALFISISFLPPEMEEGTASSNALLDNFRDIEMINRKAKGGEGEDRRVAGIHFWRPLLPEFHNKERLLEQVGLVKEAGAVSSVAVGLKLSKGIVEIIRDSKFAIPNNQPGFINPEDIPGPGDEYFPPTLQTDAVEAGEKQGFPVFLHTSCAVSHAFGRPDYNATFENPRLPSQESCNRILHQMDDFNLRQKVEKGMRRESERDWVDLGSEEIDQEQLIYLRHMLGVEIKARIKQKHEWKGSISTCRNGAACQNAHCPPGQRQICEDFYQERSKVSGNRTRT